MTVIILNENPNIGLILYQQTAAKSLTGAS
jgi:hypothetical protein